ncbi:hypothetical protein [Microbacterium algeriense]|uniref:Uncharacterized protein n=1 Tax=Microbacterium algeriense TaxID=2615184 RepID=A0ABQ6V7C3_9MICO|nr:hypothetical protein [Microbacterium algeriense]KAB1865079.1 hypothetical protein F6A08_13600 [Microbacterium algeriense]
MNLLATVMPGFREARIPLTVGALWVLAAFLFLGPAWDAVSDMIPGLRWLTEQLAAVPLVYIIGGLTFAAYLIGLALQPLSVGVARWLLRPFYRAQFADAYPEGKLARAVFRFVRRRIDVSEYLGPVGDAVMSVYVAAGLPASMALHYPNERLVARFDATALQLWKAAPDQYQEYDRLRAERDFRRAIWLPLGATAASLGLLLSWWIGLLPMIVGLALLYQSWQTDHRRAVLMANALFQGLVQDAELKSMVRILATLRMPRDWREHESLRCAVTAVAFAKVGDFESSDDLTWEAAAATLSDAVPELHRLDTSANLQTPKNRRALEGVAKRVRDIFRANDEEDEIAVYDARLRKYLKAAEAAGRTAPA